MLRVLWSALEGAEMLLLLERAALQLLPELRSSVEIAHPQGCFASGVADFPDGSLPHPQL